MNNEKKQELISISKNIIGNEETQTVDARELHQKLEVETKFSDWIKRRLEELKLVEGVDFISMLKNEKREIGATVKKEYILSLDAAKHIALMEGNDAGKRIRQYFIEVEKIARKAMTKYHENPLIAQAQQILEMTQKYVHIQEEQQKLAKLYMEQHTKQIEQDNKLKIIEDKTDNLLAYADFFTIAGFANIYGVKIDTAIAAKLGKAATSMSKNMGVMISKAKHVNYGHVNSYHKDILQSVFDKHFGK